MPKEEEDDEEERTTLTEQATLEHVSLLHNHESLLEPQLPLSSNAGQALSIEMHEGECGSQQARG